MPKAGFQAAAVQEQGIHIKANMQEPVRQGGIVQKDRGDQPPDLARPDQLVYFFADDRHQIKIARGGDRNAKMGQQRAGHIGRHQVQTG